jgi:hypothetical protein
VCSRQPFSKTLYHVKSVVFLQVWISPWQVAHVLSIVRTLQADLAPAWRPAAARSRKRSRTRSKLSYLSSSHLHVACTLHVPLISSIIMVRLSLS